VKTYCNRAERTDIIILDVYTAYAAAINTRQRDRLLDSTESTMIAEAVRLVTSVVDSVKQRMESNNKGFMKQLERDVKSARVELTTSSAYSIEAKGDTLNISKKGIRELTEGCSMQCIGCDKESSDCWVRLAKEMCDEKPVNANSEVCPYRIAEDEMEVI